MNFIRTISIIIIFLTASCSRTFILPDSPQIAHNHKVIAIIPPSVPVKANRKLDAAALKQQQETESLNFQNVIYSCLLKRKMKSDILIDIQPVETTNAKLKKAGYPDTPLTVDEMCETLGVDGIITSTIGYSKSIPDVVAALMIVLSGGASAMTPTSEAHISVSINDCANKKLIWNFDDKCVGMLGSSPTRLAALLIKRAAKRTPYNISR